MSKSALRPQVTAVVAQEIVEAVLAYAQEKRWQVAAAVVDPAGHLVAFARTEHAVPSVGQFAIDKAFTAGTLRKSTKAFGERMASSATLSLGLSARERLITWGGGLPIFEGDECIEGIGVSGAEEQEDIECAETAIRLLELSSG